VVERCLALIEGVDAPRVVDVGTGTGAIALSIAHERPDARVVATDLSLDALALARENAADTQLAVQFVATDLLEGLDGPFDLVVSNPPYVLATELDGLEEEVRSFEPRAALVDEGQTARLAEQARSVLDGWLVLEVHEHRAGEVSDLLLAAGYATVSIGLDLSGRQRVVEAQWMTSNRP